MAPDDAHTITQLLQNVRAGEQEAAGALLDVVHVELRDLAGAIFSSQRSGHTLQPTALVNEAWLKLAGHLGDAVDRVHFYAIAAQAMRQVLVDHARACRAQKRGAGNKRITLDERLGLAGRPGVDLLEFGESLERLGALNDRHARVVELRLLGGLTIAEASRILDISPTTVEDDWLTAKSWLRAELGAAQ